MNADDERDSDLTAPGGPHGAGDDPGAGPAPASAGESHGAGDDPGAGPAPASAGDSHGAGGDPGGRDPTGPLPLATAGSAHDTSPYPAIAVPHGAPGAAGPSGPPEPGAETPPPGWHWPGSPPPGWHWPGSPPPPWGQAGAAAPPPPYGWGPPPSPPGGGLPPEPATGAGPTGAPRGKHRVPVVVAALVGAAAAVLAGVGIGWGVWGTGQPTASSVPSSAPGFESPTTVPQGSPGPLDASAIAAKVDPGLVDINVTLGNLGEEGAGTGMVLTPSGTVLTNNHVIAGATSIRATDVGNGRTYTATVVGYDLSGDVAVIQLQGASGLATVSFGSSASVKVGDPVVAIGNAGGVGGKPTAVAGTVTGLNQSITAASQSTGTSEQLSGLIATNAQVEGGDSGGPLVNSSGRVIGMVTAATSDFSFGDAPQQGWAIPSDTARAIGTQISSGQASDSIHIGATAFLGVRVASAGAGPGFRFGGGLPGGQIPGAPSTSGAVVVGVEPSTPAAQAGLSAGDVITAVDGQQVLTPTTLTTLLQAHHPGDTVQLSWQDTSGQSHTTPVTLASGPPA